MARRRAVLWHRGDPGLVATGRGGEAGAGRAPGQVLVEAAPLVLRQVEVEGREGEVARLLVRERTGVHGAETRCPGGCDGVLRIYVAVTPDRA